EVKGDEEGRVEARIDDRNGVTLRERHQLLSPSAKTKAAVQQQNPCFAVVWASCGRKRRRAARTKLARHKEPRAFPDRPQAGPPPRLGHPPQATSPRE